MKENGSWQSDDVKVSKVSGPVKSYFLHKMSNPSQTASICFQDHLLCQQKVCFTSDVLATVLYSLLSLLKDPGPHCSNFQSLTIMLTSGLQRETGAAG